jgi:putative acetyltransferase
VNRNESPDIRVALESPEQPEVLALVAELDAHSNELTPPARGRGVGSAILGFLEAEAGSRGCRKLMLETGHQHHLAHRAYRANGYRVCGPFGSYGPDPLSVFMEKAIPGRPGPQTP